MKINGTILPRETTEYDNPTDPIVNYLVEHAEALRVVKGARGRTIFVRGNGFAPSKNQEGVEGNQVRGRDVFVSVVVSKRAALRHLESDYMERTRNECYVRLTVSNRCLWIG